MYDLRHAATARHPVKPPVPPPLMDTPTAAVIIIGNEILSGKTIDQNTPYLARNLHALGVDLQRIAVVPDEVPVIAEEVAVCKEQFTWVITTGGVGPTHDDVTMAGIAAGVGASLTRHPDLERRVLERFGPTPNRAQLKMAEAPRGATVIGLTTDGGPIVRVENIFIFPGVPEYLVRKFENIKETLRAAPFYGAEIFLDVREEAIADLLDETVVAFPALRLGSYPHVGRTGYRVTLTLESKMASCVTAATRFLETRLPAGALLHVKAWNFDLGGG